MGFQSTGKPNRSWVTFHRDSREIAKGRWDGRANARTAPRNINWDYGNLDFDEAVCVTTGGKRLVIKKKLEGGMVCTKSNNPMTT
jgi:hypothetical protein